MMTLSAQHKGNVHRHAVEDSNINNALSQTWSMCQSAQHPAPALPTTLTFEPITAVISFWYEVFVIHPFTCRSVGGGCGMSTQVDGGTNGPNHQWSCRRTCGVSCFRGVRIPRHPLCSAARRTPPVPAAGSVQRDQGDCREELCKYNSYCYYARYLWPLTGRDCC